MTTGTIDELFHDVGEVRGTVTPLSMCSTCLIYSRFCSPLTSEVVVREFDGYSSVESLQS